MGICRNIMALATIGIALFFGLVVKDNITSSQTKFDHSHPKLTKEGGVLNDKGEIVEQGWFMKAMKSFNAENVKSSLGLPAPLNKLAIKKWDFFSFATETYIVRFGMANLGYSNFVFAELYDFSKKEKKHAKKVLFSSLNITNDFYGDEFQNSVLDGSQEFHYKSLKASSKEKFSRNVKFISKDFSFSVIYQSPYSSNDMCTVLPLSEDHKNFYYNLKGYYNEVVGTMRVGDKEVKLNTKFAVHDFGRGVWNYHNYWVWAYGFFQLNKQFTISLNLGGGSATEISDVTEDSFFINGVLHKLSTVKHERKGAEWHFHTVKNVKGFGQCDLVFKIHKEMEDSENLLLVKMNMKQFPGEWSGKVVTEGGQSYQIQKGKGFVEEMKARW